MEKFNVYSFFQTLSFAEDAQYKTFDDWFTEFFKSNLDNLTEPELAYVYVSMMDLLPDLAGDGDDDRGNELVEKAISLILKNVIKRDLVLGKYIKEEDNYKTEDYCKELNPKIQEEQDYWQASHELNHKKEVESSTFAKLGWSFNLIYIILPIFIIISVIAIVITSPDKECEEVVWYEYGEKKTGIICDDQAKARMESMREEMGLYKKKE